MTRLELAELALNGVVQVERAGGREAYWLGLVLRMVIGSWVTMRGFDAVRNGIEVDQHAQGFPVLTHQHLNDLKYQRKAG